MSAPVHLKPTCELAPRVLLPGDPGRALLVAQDVLDAPRMFNHHRGLWGYTGTAADGEPLTVQATGMGGPSAAIVCEELCALGASTLVRIGTCGALDPGLGLGDLVIADAALALDGAGGALAGPGAAVAPDAGLVAALTAGAPLGRRGPVASVDLFYSDGDERATARARGALAVEMEAATVLAVAARRGARAACVLAVSDVLGSGEQRARLDDEGVEAAGLAVGRAGAAALLAA